MVFRSISEEQKEMSKGMRDMSRTPLTDKEIAFVKKEIRRINADESKFVFNDKEHMGSSTCYNFSDDLIYVTRNVFPDNKYGSTHARDLMSVRAVLAHEYYGHRPYRDEYLSDYAIGREYHTVELWEDECRASITAAKTCPGLTEIDRCHLVQDAILRAEEAQQLLEMDSFMKEVLYGYSDSELDECDEQSPCERRISTKVGPIIYVSASSQIRMEDDERSPYCMPEM